MPAVASEAEAAHRLWCSSARRCGLCSPPRRRTPTTFSGTAGWGTRGNTCLLKANACAGKKTSDLHAWALPFQGPLTTGALLAAVCAAARTRARPSFRLTPAAAHHLTWPAGGCAQRSKPVHLAAPSHCDQASQPLAHLQHLASSRPSEQSFTPSHTLLRGMQRPSPQRNWRGQAGDRQGGDVHA